MIEVSVNGIFLTQSQASGIILKEKNGSRTLPIVIGEYEAQSIALGLENIKPPRPITHDLALNLLEACGVTMDSVLITELKNNTYYAVIRLRKKLKYWDVDARPSDAIAMAVRSTIPIFVDEQVMEVGAYEPEEAESEPEIKTFGAVTKNLKICAKSCNRQWKMRSTKKQRNLRDRIKQIESGS